MVTLSCCSKHALRPRNGQWSTYLDYNVEPQQAPPPTSARTLGDLGRSLTLALRLDMWTEDDWSWLGVPAGIRLHNPVSLLDYSHALSHRVPLSMVQRLRLRQPQPIVGMEGNLSAGACSRPREGPPSAFPLIGCRPPHWAAGRVGSWSGIACTPPPIFCYSRLEENNRQQVSTVESQMS